MHPDSLRPDALTVAGFGQCSLDYLCVVDAFPVSDTKCEFSEFTIQGGGPVATALVTLTRWGIAARLASVVCNDAFGLRILKGLERENIDLSATLIREGVQSQFAFVCVEAESGKRTIFWGRPDAEPVRANEIPKDFLEGVHALHLDGLHMEASVHLAGLAQERGIPVILDAGSLRPGVTDLIQRTDHFIAAENFAGQFAPEKSLPDLLQDLKRMGPEVVAITMGERGSLCLWEDEPQWLPALDIQAKDTTGAGDVFHGAYIYGLLQGWAPPDRFRWATVTASLSCLSLGGRAGIPSRKSVEKALKDLGDFQRASHKDPGR